MCDNDKARSGYDRWEETTLGKSLERFGERRETFETTSGIELKRLYTEVDGEDRDYVDELGFPGEYPFTRGVQPTMYRGRFWTMRQYAGFGTADETNDRFKFLLDKGQTGLSVAFDLPTQLGRDSDDALAQGEIGKVGVAIDSLADMERLFDGIPLDKVSTSMTINAPAAVLLAMYMAVARKQGVDVSKLKGTIQNDILKEYAARGTYIFPPRPSMRLITDVFGYCADSLPSWNTISISGYHIREAGSTAVQEIAFTLANACSYVQAAIDAGMDVDKFAPRLSFFFNAHNNLLEEVAKFRACRRLWARIMKEVFGASNPKSLMLRFHTQTAGCTLTAQQPLNNVVRVAMQALAAVLGGTQSLHTNSYDEALSLPTEESVQVALRTQQILAQESGVADMLDPLGGSYAVESLTDELEKKAAEYLDKIDALGGAVAAIERGFIQDEIHRSAYQYQREVEENQRIVVGVNEYTDSEQSHSDKLLRVNPEIERQQVDRLTDLRNSRDAGAVTKALAELRSTASGSGNLMPPILQAVEAYATLGEICGVLRQEFGEYKAPTGF